MLSSLNLTEQVLDILVQMFRNKSLAPHRMDIKHLSLLDENQVLIMLKLDSCIHHINIQPCDVKLQKIVKRAVQLSGIHTI